MEPEAPRKGDVYVIDFGAAGEGIRKVRPGVVISMDRANLRATQVAVAPVRSAEARRPLPLHAFLPAGEAGLVKDSLADLGLVQAVPKARLGRRLGHLGPDAMDRVDAAIRFYFGV